MELWNYGMFSVLLKWRKKRDSVPEVPYSLACACGKRLMGRRRSESQTLTCPKCGARHFIFPASPLVFFRSTRSRSRSISEQLAQPNLHFWRKPLWAALIAVLVLLPGVIWLTQTTLFQSDKPRPKTPDEADIAAIVREGRRALSDGLYHNAAEYFRQARQLAKPDAQAELEQLENEAALMNDLLSESIPEILRQAVGVNNRAWQERFRARYRGQSILFDAFVQRTREGYRIDYQLMLGKNTIRVDLGDQAILARISLDEPRRLLFGFRLGEMKQVRDDWVVVAEPDSVVLIAESATLKGGSVPVDGELSHLLAEQGRMLQRIRDSR